MEMLWHDARYGARLLGRSPALTVVVVLILAMGIGANTAVFSVVNAVILRPLPYAEARRLVTLTERGERYETATVHDRFLRWRDQSTVFEHMTAYSGRRPYVTGIDRPRYVWALAVSSDLFSLLGVQPLLGRGFLPAEEQPGNHRVVVLSHDFWRDEFGGSPEAIGKTIILDEQSHTIVGVMPSDFTFPVDSDRAFWMPLVHERSADWPSGGLVFGLARLKKGCTLAQARAAMTVIGDRLKQTDSEAGVILVRRLLDRKLGANRRLLWLLLGGAGVVLLIACTNVASLFLARATVRQREMALRVALGASRGRVMRQLFTESLLLSAGAGVLGLLATFPTIKLLVRLCPADVPRLAETNVDGAVLAFTLGVSAFTGLLFGVMPAWRASDTRVSSFLKEGQTRSSTGRRWQRLHGGLVVAQTGLSVVLLIGAALLIRTWIALQRADLGFRPEHVLTVDISLTGSQYPVYDRCGAFFEPLLRQVRALPGVRAAALTPFLDFGIDAMKWPFTIVGQPPVPPEEATFVKCREATPGFFAALGMRLLKGRTFTEEDMGETAHDAIIDENFARLHFADIDPIGQKVRIEEVDHTIIGMVSVLRDFKHLDPALGVLYVPGKRYYRDMVLVVRTDGDPLRLAGAIRAHVADLETDQVISGVETLDAHLSDMLAPQRFSLVMLGLFAGIALTLAAVGIYGLLQYSTTQQTHDIGIRMALGAQRVDVLRAVLGHGLRLTLVGVALGLAGALVLTRFLSHLLYGVLPVDLLTYVCVSVVLISIALLASYLPARRAAGVDPMVSLRYE